MNDEQKAHFDEWQRKCAETKARTSRELAEAQSKISKEKPGYRLITRGPNKGQLKWVGYRQRGRDTSSVVLARISEEREARKLHEPLPILEQPKRGEKVSPEIIWAFVFIFSVSIISFLIAKLFAYLGFMGLAVLIDAVCYHIFAQKSRYSRYLPFLWWFLSPKKQRRHNA
jgi:hypothetical protein